MRSQGLLAGKLLLFGFKFDGEVIKLDELSLFKIKERQAQGIAIAKQRGRFKGRKKKYSFEDEGLQHAFDLYQQGLTEKEIERKTGINRTTFRRYRQKYNVVREDRKE